MRQAEMKAAGEEAGAGQDTNVETIPGSFTF
jgi:hypothetical protein